MINYSNFYLFVITTKVPVLVHERGTTAVISDCSFAIFEIQVVMEEITEIMITLIKIKEKDSKAFLPSKSMTIALFQNGAVLSTRTAFGVGVIVFVVVVVVVVVVVDMLVVVVVVVVSGATVVSMHE